MEDRDVLPYIEKLVKQEQKLARLHEQGALTEEQHASMRQLELYLDQCWDLLRQRRARRKAGLDPADARLRDVDSVELFSQ
jgi:Protein of unknown function (DUF2630)